MLSRISSRGEGRVEFGRIHLHWSEFYVGIVQRPRMYVAFILFYGQAIRKVIVPKELCMMKEATTENLIEHINTSTMSISLGKRKQDTNHL